MSDFEQNRGRKIEVVGQVVSNKMDKTISVLIYRTVKHEKYGKYIKKTSVFKAHDEKMLPMKVIQFGYASRDH